MGSSPERSDFVWEEPVPSKLSVPSGSRKYAGVFTEWQVYARETKFVPVLALPYLSSRELRDLSDIRLKKSKSWPLKLDVLFGLRFLVPRVHNEEELTRVIIARRVVFSKILARNNTVRNRMQRRRWYAEERSSLGVNKVASLRSRVEVMLADSDEWVVLEDPNIYGRPLVLGSWAFKDSIFDDIDMRLVRSCSALFVLLPAHLADKTAIKNKMFPSSPEKYWPAIPPRLKYRYMSLTAYKRAVKPYFDHRINSRGWELEDFREAGAGAEADLDFLMKRMYREDVPYEHLLDASRPLDEEWLKNYAELRVED